IEMTKKEGYEASEDHGMTVVLDLNLTEELIEEGFAAELVSKVQTMRKDSGFEVMDHIRISLNGNEKLLGIVKKNEEQISTKLLADEITSGKDFAFSKEWDINGEKVTISLEKI
ncbi:MAG: isoleucine--tRNA ligase, partial [Lachnospiraceae bacterium]|nr:isoleucine--tRNA ligase [Lachnospiraceae bacterium]